MSLIVDPEPVPLVRDERGVWRVGGTRVTLETLVAAFNRGDATEEIREQYPTIALGDVYAVLTFCVRHRGAVRMYLDERARGGAEIQARAEREFRPDGLRERLLERSLAGTRVSIGSSIVWRWTEGRSPYAVPSALWRLGSAVALGVFEPAVHVWWRGPDRTFDLSVRSDRLRAYAIVLQEGVPSDIEAVVDGVLLCEAWSDLVLPNELRAAWADLIAAGRQ